MHEAAVNLTIITAVAPFIFALRPAVWSLGATLYCLAFGYSPFESIRTEGGRLKLADPSHLKVRTCQYIHVFMCIGP